MDRQVLIKEFKKAVINMKENHLDGTYYWYLDTDKNNNDWAIVLGWQDGFDIDKKDDCLYGSCRLSVKLAYQPRNSIMQDYDIDWIMPYNEATNEVYDNEISLYPDTDLDNVINWLLECYESYKEYSMNMIMKM